MAAFRAGKKVVKGAILWRVVRGVARFVRPKIEKRMAKKSRDFFSRALRRPQRFPKVPVRH